MFASFLQLLQTGFQAKVRFFMILVAKQYRIEAGNHFQSGNVLCFALKCNQDHKEPKVNPADEDGMKHKLRRN